VLFNHIFTQELHDFMFVTNLTQKNLIVDTSPATKNSTTMTVMTLRYSYKFNCPFDSYFLLVHNNYLVVAAENCIVLADHRGEVLQKFETQRTARSVAVNSKNKLVAAIGTRIVEFNENMNDYQVLCQQPFRVYTRYTAHAIDDQDYLYTASSDGSVKIFDSTNQVVYEIEKGAIFRKCAFGMAIFNNRLYVVGDHHVLVTSLDVTPIPLFSFDITYPLLDYYRTSPMFNSFFINNIGELFVCRRDSKVQIFDAYTGSFVALLDLKLSTCAMIHEIGPYYTMFLLRKKHTDDHSILETYSYRARRKLWTSGNPGIAFSDISIICFDHEENITSDQIMSDDYSDDYLTEDEMWDAYWEGFNPELAVRVVLFIVTEGDSQIGIHCDEVYARFSTHYSSKDLAHVIGWQKAHGVIYNTIDEYHIQCHGSYNGKSAEDIMTLLKMAL
jgi:WD40 repeat protein